MEVPRFLIVKPKEAKHFYLVRPKLQLHFKREQIFFCNSSAAKTCLTVALTFPLLVAAAEASSSREASRSVTAAAAAGAEAAEAMAEDVFSLLLAIDKLACD